jgi:Aspartyl protease
MRIVGEWQVGDDDVTRPFVRAKVQAAAGTLQRAVFLVDSGADRTVFSANLVRELGFATTPAEEGLALEGIGGECGFLVVKTVVELTRDDGGVVHMRGEFAAFTDSAASDPSILGRDILNHFDVILSRRRSEVLLLASKHQYRVDLV